MRDHTQQKSQCFHPNMIIKKYVGSFDVYRFCPDCWETWDGEESYEKKRIISDACYASEMIPIYELDSDG